MRIIAAYMLAVLGGASAPTADQITNILSKVGVTPDAAEVTAVIAGLKGKSAEDVKKLVEDGNKKLSSFAAPAAAAAAPAAAPAKGGDAKNAGKGKEAAKKPEPKKEEKKEDSDAGADMDLGGLF
eukprot:TRINITY_DN1941_c0_g1_i1.p2 TRINITY_DN1941_c0_g1~~TRINITY_DN1941_c0_g1_i1.p2  ORF type:complete len:125 (-),score=54.38 TRINITY_DN1941_c0_g1_i1:48-422(-)